MNPQTRKPHLTPSSNPSNDSSEPSLSYYLGVVGERRDLLSKIRKLHDELAETSKNIKHNDHVKNEVERQIKDFFRCEVPDLMAYKGLRDIIQDGITIQTRMFAHQGRLQEALKENEHLLAKYDAHIQSMKVYFKGRGKVISLERYRSQKANS